MAVETRPTTASEAPATAAVRLRDVSVLLGGRYALRDIDCEIAAGAFVGLIGPNGSGKSTLLRAVLGILPLASGSVLVNGQPPAQQRKAFAYLPQRQYLELDLPLRARDVVMMGRMRHGSWLRPPSRRDREVVAVALDTVGLSDRAAAPIGALSFGQQQRLLFARALAQEGEIILLDEPMNGVDSTTQDIILELLSGLHAQGKTVVMATHDLNQACSVCDSLLVLNKTLVAFGAVDDVLSEDVLLRAYGVHLHLPSSRSPDAHVLEDIHHHDTDSDRTRDARLV